MAISILFFLLIDIILINIIKDKYFLNFLIYFLITLRFLSNLLTSSFITIFTNIKNYKVNNIILIYIIFIFLLFFLIAILIFLLVNQNSAYKSYIIDNIFYLLLLFLSIPINSILSSKLINDGKRIFIFLFQLLVPILSIILIINNDNLIKNIFLILFLTSYTYSFILLIALIKFNKNNFWRSLSLHNNFLKIIHAIEFFNKILLQLILFFCANHIFIF